MREYPITLIEMSQLISQIGDKPAEYNGHLIYKLRENFYAIFNRDFTDAWSFNSQTGDYRHIAANDHPVFEEIEI